MKEVGHHVVVEVRDLGVQIFWDKGTRINLQVDQKWKNHVRESHLKCVKYFIV